MFTNPVVYLRLLGGEFPRARALLLSKCWTRTGSPYPRESHFLEALDRRSALYSIRRSTNDGTGNPWVSFYCARNCLQRAIRAFVQGDAKGAAAIYWSTLGLVDVAGAGVKS
ncbi:MAG: hypothetical protein KC492_07790, partial [Myxococcales bacterium]|nr:hypothetical protein [Myxococcales bacterium]